MMISYIHIVHQAQLSFAATKLAQNNGITYHCIENLCSRSGVWSDGIFRVERVLGDVRKGPADATT